MSGRKSRERTRIRTAQNRGRTHHACIWDTPREVYRYPEGSVCTLGAILYKSLIRYVLHLPQGLARRNPQDLWIRRKGSYVRRPCSLPFSPSAVALHATSAVACLALFRSKAWERLEEREDCPESDNRDPLAGLQRADQTDAAEPVEETMERPGEGLKVWSGHGGRFFIV